MKLAVCQDISPHPFRQLTKVQRQRVSQTVLSRSIRTLEIILSVGVVGFVVMYHLHDLEKIVFLELRERIGQLLHVDVAAGGFALGGFAGRGAIQGFAGWA